jgi:hypothetical protein
MLQQVGLVQVIFECALSWLKVIDRGLISSKIRANLGR